MPLAVASRRSPRSTRLVALHVSLACLACGARSARTAPTLGFLEEFPGTTLSTWGGGATLSNPGTGGVGGIGDGFLSVSTSTPARLGTVSTGSEYVGNWTAAGITQVRVWVKDIGGTGNLSIHMAIGNGTADFWEENQGINPPADRWAEYVVDLTNAADFTLIRGSGTFANALTIVDRLLFRHDLPPLVASPDLVQGNFGLDHLRLASATTGVELPAAVSRPVLLAPPYPNPARGRVTFSLRVPGAGPVTLRIVDLAGRVLRHATLAPGPGDRLWLWDGSDDSGRPAPSGRYMVFASGPGGGTTRGFTLLR